eukprot:TRINITY_DN122021_c0_g1_i1.p1 TRINITY_DN122021_c0_g1~~TRINITY_DN122021_c0_g1_i1.p1  ORF type:complete len:391 (+),score=55.63 TRINITY_DN122021_c0_g1_i1:91-1263(+)
MSVVDIDEGSNRLLGILSDPTVQQPTTEDRRRVRLMAGASLVMLVASTASSFLMFEDSGKCLNGTHSGLPFNLVHSTHGVYDGLMGLTFFAAATAWLYPIATARKARPRFLHVAGSYLMVNAATCACSVTTTWAGCASHHALGYVYHFLRVPTAFLSLVGTVASFVLLQYCILSKVEALEESGATIATGHARALFKILLNPCTLGFGLLSAVIPLGLVREGGTFLLILYSQAAFMLVFATIFIVFTGVCITTILRCFKNLAFCSLDAATKSRLRRLLLVHALAALAANTTTVIYYISIAGVVLRYVDVKHMFMAFAVDNVCNVFCAVTLSGLLGSVFGGESMAPLPSNQREGGKRQGVVETMEFAAQAAAKGVGRATYSNLEYNESVGGA